MEEYENWKRIPIGQQTLNGIELLKLNSKSKFRTYNKSV